MSRDAVTAAGTVTFDLHGAVRVRLISPRPGDVEAASRQLGLLPATEAASPRPRPRPAAGPAPEIRIRFVDGLRHGPSAYLEDRRIGFGGETFYLRSANGRGCWVRVPIDRFGSDECEFVCPHGSGSVPLLREAVALAALHGGLTPVHASGFTHGSAGVLVAGWAHSGKTSSLLAFTREGAAFVGDDQLFVSGDGAMYGTRTPLELADWQLRQIPEAWERTGRGRRAAVRGLAALGRVRGRGFEDAAHAGGARPLMARLLGGLERRLRVRLPADAVCPRLHEGAAPLTHVAFVSIHAAPDVRVERCDPGEMLERLCVLGRHERLALVRAHLAYQCAFPGRRNERIDVAADTEARLLRQALAGTGTFVVRHPRPLPLQRLYEAMRPILDVEAGQQSRPALVAS